MLNVAVCSGNISTDWATINIAVYGMNRTIYRAFYVDISNHGLDVANVSCDRDFGACVDFEFVDIAVDGNIDFLRVCRCDIFAINDDSPATDVQGAAIERGAIDNDRHAVLLRIEAIY